MTNTDFDGLLKDEMTEPYIEYVRARLDGRRLCHSVETARLAAELAGRNGVSPSVATVAGLIHDMARPFSDDELLGGELLDDELLDAELSVEADDGDDVLLEELLSDDELLDELFNDDELLLGVELLEELFNDDELLEDDGLEDDED